jgi:hypothetical protein
LRPVRGKKLVGSGLIKKSLFRLAQQRERRGNRCDESLHQFLPEISLIEITALGKRQPQPASQSAAAVDVTSHWQLPKYWRQQKSAFAEYVVDLSVEISYDKKLSFKNNDLDRTVWRKR